MFFKICRKVELYCGTKLIDLLGFAFVAVLLLNNFIVPVKLFVSMAGVDSSTAPHNSLCFLSCGLGLSSLKEVRCQHFILDTVSEHRPLQLQQLTQRGSF